MLSVDFYVEKKMFKRVSLSETFFFFFVFFMIRFIPITLRIRDERRNFDCIYRPRKKIVAQLRYVFFLRIEREAIVTRQVPRQHTLV